MTLCNDTAAAFGYRLASRAPFSIVQLDRATRHPTSHVNRTGRSVLQPRQRTNVNVAFCLTPDLVNYVHSLEFLEGPSPDGVQLVRSDEGPRRLLFRVPLNIEFDSGSIQPVPLEATVVMPSIQLATDTLDFGLCFVGQTRELTTILSSPTGCNSFWQCKKGMFYHDCWLLSVCTALLDCRVDSIVVGSIRFCSRVMYESI